MRTKLKSVIYALLIPFGACGAAAVAGAPPTPGQAFGPDLFSTQGEPVLEHTRVAAAADPVARLMYWNTMALRANVLDHTPPPRGSVRVFGEQYGPPRSTRALAIVQIAVFDAMNAISRRYPSYSGMTAAPSDSSYDAAIACAAKDALVALYPSQAAWLNERYTLDMQRVPDGRAKNNGVETGRRAAAAMLALRASDGMPSDEAIVWEDFEPSLAPGTWRPDPVSRSLLALGAHWHHVKPFVLSSVRDFLPAAPPALNSSAYAAAFNEVKELGGDGVTTPTRRTAQQTIAGIYWAYDSTPGMGSPPRQYNQIALEIARVRGGQALETARMLALINAAMADTAMVVWDAKYRYQFWRPVTGIREASGGTGPTGQGDGNPYTRADTAWTPLGAPASNLRAPNFTPPFPSYVSGHASLGSALFQTLRLVYGTDKIPFTFVSDEFNGITRDNRGNVRPRLPRSFASLSQAEEENGHSRIYLGVHWSFDKTNGQQVGRRVANYVVQRGLVQPGN